MAIAAREPLGVVAGALAPGDLVPREASLAVVEAFGAKVVAAYRFDAGERERRVAAGMAPLTRPDALNLLMALPLGEPVPAGSLSDRERRALRCLPKGAVIRRDGLITRQATQPVHVDMVFVPGRSWESAMEQAERFTPFTARSVLVDGVLRRKGEAVMRADFYGIGLLHVQEAAVEVVVPPSPFVRRRHTVAGWKFLEDVHRQLA
ncbi:hypothetical protein GO001_33390 [Streptomyces sp. NRRL B-1677]|uniref:hypothetical protein n=1 Tax=Streptomyces sp. NRRL B-1677 TaxID=2682966 RepID=UPI0018928B5B|nr:hypothetical protein [Streptomyces sp. NRRL B-1677]MBF6050021.1 hypothetical protein [Streptomyces sp. NRRL B-1677]